MAFTRHVKFEDSSTIGSISYDFDSKTLRIFFASTQSVWDYYNVYPTDFAKLAASYSPGEIFNARFRNKFNCEKVSVDPPKGSREPSVQDVSSEQEEKMVSPSEAQGCSGTGFDYPNCCAKHREAYYNTAG